MSHFFFTLRRDVLVHKLRYSKTIKGDWAGAFLGLCFGLLVGYIALASLGACSIDLADLTLFIFFLSCVLSIFFFFFKKKINNLFFFLSFFKEFTKNI